MYYDKELDRHYFWCGKKAKGVIHHKQKIKRTCFLVCEHNCKKYKDIMNCEAYTDALEEATRPEEQAA